MIETEKIYLIVLTIIMFFIIIIILNESINCKKINTEKYESQNRKI